MSWQDVSNNMLTQSFQTFANNCMFLGSFPWLPDCLPCCKWLFGIEACIMRYCKYVVYSALVPPSTVGSESDCESRGCLFNSGSSNVLSSRFGYQNNFLAILTLWQIMEGHSFYSAKNGHYILVNFHQALQGKVCLG